MPAVPDPPSRPALPTADLPAAPLAAEHPLVTGATASSRLVTALSGTRPSVLPVWFMRQAGRSLPEYRATRAGIRMLDACLEPSLASEITLQPVRRHGVDAAVFFSDIVVPLRLAGVDVAIEPGRGPVFASPVRTARDVAALPELDPAALAPIEEAVRLTVAQLADAADGPVPLVGFAGAPFTLAAYLVEGGPSKDHLAARTLMHADPDAWSALMAWTARVTGAFLESQVRAGASAAQLFDSWAGGLGLADYEEHVAPASRAALAPVRSLAGPGDDGRRVPVIHFGVGTSELLVAMRDVGADAIGVDWRLPLDVASRRLGGTTPLQGNLDPAYLAAPWPVLERHVREVVERGRAAPAHVVNLGHGVPPQTDPDVLTRVVRLVHGLEDEVDVSGAGMPAGRVDGSAAVRLDG